MLCLFMLLSNLSFVTPKAFGLSIEVERRLGEEFVAQIRGYFKLVDDEYANQFITDLGRYLTMPLETKPFPFHFYIIKDNTLNAFAGPGGHIFVFSGLIEAMDNLDELASVICHELGHVTARHISQRIEQSKKIGLATMAAILAGALIGGELSGAVMTGAMAAGMQAQLSYSRNDERQADQLGFKYTKLASFDPAGLISSLKKIQKGQWFGTDRVPAYLLTHPTGPERMSNLDSMLTHFKPDPPTKETIQLRKRFPFFKTILRAECMGSQEAERLFHLDLEKDPSSLLAHFGLGIVYREKSEYDRAIRHLKIALKEDPDSISILTNLGQTYHMAGQDREAIPFLEKAFDRDGQSHSTIFLLALSYENLEKYEMAIQLLEKLTYLKPVDNEVYYHLGLSYGRQNRLALAHYNFGLYFSNLRQMQKASFHFQKADSLSDNNPALKKKIHDAIKELGPSQ
ncbi:MAG: M48 family metalloprotease [Desulfobacterales bacterium]|nr:M48 family metalloprotease [Pseudomonadota bacterium]MCG2774734.1 M48 family metalloprotease [Desulfobacterales bacterium]